MIPETTHIYGQLLDYEIFCSKKLCSVCCETFNFNLFVSTVAVNEAGDTPLSLECSRGDLKMVKALINKHVDPNSKTLCLLSGMLLMVVFHRASQQGW